MRILSVELSLPLCFGEFSLLTRYQSADKTEFQIFDINKGNFVAKQSFSNFNPTIESKIFNFQFW